MYQYLFVYIYLFIVHPRFVSVALCLV